MHVLKSVYSKQRWRTIRERKRARKRKRDLVVSRALCRARLFIYFCSGVARARARYTRWIVSLASLFFLFTYTQADFRQHQTKKKKETKRERGRRRKENTEGVVVSRYRRPPRLITDNEGVRYKTKEQRLRERREREKEQKNGELLKILINTLYIRRE